jgi:hypothetical protein
MYTIRVAAGVAFVLGAAACGGADDDAASTVMPDVVGLQLDVALDDIEGAGFEDDVDVISDATFGVIDESNWQVCEQSPAAGEPLADAPELTVDRSCDESSTESTSVTTEDVPESTEPPSTTAAEPARDEILTVANSPEFAAFLAEPDYCSDAIGAFASAHTGQTIEFDGSVVTADNFSSDPQRQHILVSPGDLGPESVTGPAFQYRDVNITDLNFTGPSAPDSVSPGDKLHVVAEIEEYNSTQCLVFLNPVSTQVR